MNFCTGFSDFYFRCTFFVVFVTLNFTYSGKHAFAQSAGETSSTTWLDEQRKVQDTFSRLEQSNNYTESLSYADMNTLPMGIKQTIGNIQVTIAVSDMRWETTHSELTVFAKIKIPQENDKILFFGAQGIKLSNNGDIIGDASLVLMGDFTIPINGNTAALRLKGSFDKNTGRAKELTYVSIDCLGFREMGITAEVEFPESLMKAVNAEGAKIPGRVKGGFRTIVKDWNDIIAAIALPPFEISGLDGFIFTLGEAVFDFSDLRNDPAIVYPEGYQANYMIPGNPALWRGVFVHNLSITLPKPFSDKNKVRPSFGATNLLIDNNGISGLFAATGILPIDKGSASGWRFSVDTFLMGIEANRLTEAGFKGMIGLPVSEKSNLGYEAVITADNEYMLRVKPMGKMNFDVFNAEAELLPNSYVELKVVDDKFKPEAMLHGSLNLAARLGKEPQDTTAKAIAKFKGIEFRSLHLKTESPRFTADYFGYKGELKMMNFPVSVDRIGVRILENEVALGMDIKLTLSDNMFTGSTRVEFVGKLEQTGNTPEEKTDKWKYDKLNLSSIAIDATVAETFRVKAGLTILSDDPVYGDGFAGNIELTFQKVMKGMNIQARAMFGRTTFRYWFVDGKVKFGQGIPVFPPLSINGFGGGVYSRMKREGGDAQSSPTGCKYVPDENSGLGVKAAVLFNVANDAAINGEASFEIAFSRSGGLNFIGFYGFAKFAGKIPGTENVEKFVGDKFKKVAELENNFIGKNPALAQTLETLKQHEPNKVPEKVFQPTVPPGSDGFAAAVGIQYDFTQNALHATFDLYVNSMGGVVRGTASGNRAGWAVLHVDPQEWYVRMGTPTDRLGLKMGIGGISLETGSYLMMGSSIPGSPAPPKEVADILGVDLAQLDYMRDLNALGDGRGFAFGASLRVATGDITFLVLYANFQAGLGFDIMLKDYQDMECKGRSGPIGMNGWYANGQSYAYLQGELGIKVNLWFLKTKVPIIKGAAATLLQAKLPNPAWFRGYLAVKFNVLGGLVSGNCRFKFTIGEECELVIPGGSPLDVRMISDLTPKNNADAVDVFAAPQAAFNMKVGVPFDIQDDKGYKSYRIQLNKFTVLDEKQELEGKIIWTDGKDVASFYSKEVLPPAKELKAIVKVGFEEWQNGKWNVVYTSGVKAEETMEVVFKTGTAPDAIPMQNIDFSYPVVDQKFFLKDEDHTGNIQLKRGQSYLFSNSYKHEIQLLTATGEKQAVSFNYNTGTNRIEYALPELSVSNSYSLHLVSMREANNANGTTPQQNANVGNASDSIVLSSNQAATVVRNDIGKTLLEYNFATSRYGTFSQKITAIQKGSAVAGRLASDVINLQYEIQNGEPFEQMELSGTSFSGNKPLIKAEAVLSDLYYQEDIFPMNYQNYISAGVKLLRPEEEMGIPPVKAIALSTQYLTEIESNNFSGYAAHRFPFIYNLPQIYKEDFTELQNKIVNQYSGTPKASQYNYIINGYYHFIRSGNYPVRFTYVLPDGKQGSNAVFEFYNFIK